MAHHHSPSPSGDSRRRLSELLGEQQEPFYLDLFLLEKGCSSTFLDAAACGACSPCWSKARRSSGGSRLLRRPPARSKKKGPRRNGGVLRLLLSKFLSGAATATPAAAAKKKKKKRRRQQQLPAAAIDWSHVDVDEKQSTAGPSTNAVECHLTDVVDDEQPEEEDDDEEDESSSKKQLSPVSVLEQRLFEHSPPPPPHTQRALVLFSELLEAAYAPSTLLHLLANAKQYSISVSNKSRGDDKAPTTTRRRSRRRTKKNGGGRRKGDDDEAPFERDLARATALVGSEMGGGARVRPDDVAAEREEVAADIAAAVLEELTEELMLVAMGMAEMDHGGCAARGRR
ncbi:hypothetical protein HU200_058165 [Digitaria exilis]|uniref:Uncharacterized protein n=1 Tax=Digitaria exilis TaxID=1010633 RepID=A0A835AA03_9POAL|nr:hypothetical protein HU200_058166 [Digitaria exilis]KAF8659909.1 hypothetical protein HU200_058165 [Digitaria exilis]CAB3462079.1 unnamed protein product [Digitaria exilis]